MSETTGDARYDADAETFAVTCGFAKDGSVADNLKRLLRRVRDETGNVVMSLRYERAKQRVIEKAARDVHAEAWSRCGAMYEANRPFALVSWDAINALHVALEAIGPELDDNGTPITRIPQTQNTPGVPAPRNTEGDGT